MTSAEERARHLEAYGGAIAPPSDRRARNLHALRERLRLQAEAATTCAPAGAPRSIVPTAIATSVAIAAAVLFVLWGAMTGVRALRDGARAPMLEAPATSDRARSGGSAQAGTRGPAHERSPERARAAVVSSASPAIDPDGAASGRGEAKPRRATDPAEAQREADDRLRAELALVRSARAALKREDFAAVWTLTNTHAADHPRGALAHERDAWRAVAACRLHLEQAGDAFSSFVRDHDGSPYLARVRAACETR